MKAKKMWTVAACLSLFLLNSCGNGGKQDSLFGEIPGIYEEKIEDVAKKMAELQNKDKKESDVASALKVLAELTEAFERAEEEAKPLAEKMVGKTLPFSCEEGLPVKIVSDIQVEKVNLPKMELFNGGDKPVRLNVTFDAVVTAEPKPYYRLYYQLLDNDKVMGQGRCSSINKVAVGDTIHYEETIYAPDAPAKYQESCNSLKFVSEESYKAEQENVTRQQKQWNDEKKKEMGLDK